MNKTQSILIRTLTVLLAVVLAVVSIFGAFVEKTYEREVDSLAAQGMGQDIVDLFIVVPLLIISMIFMQKNHRTGTFIFGGTVFYILYSFVIYTLGIHFNNLFLLYCLTFGSAFYLFILYLYSLKGTDVKNWFEDSVPVKTIGIYFIVVAVMFYFLWLSDIIPAIISNDIPESVKDYNLLVNPVHVLDIAIALPALIITSILLFKKNNLGYIFAPIFLVFIIILTIALAGMVIMSRFKGITEDISIAVIFIVLAVISSFFLWMFLRRIRQSD